MASRAELGRAATATTSSPPTHDRSSLDATLAALADPLRRRTVDLLALGPRRAGELAADLGVPTMRKHRRILREVGIVADRAPAFDTRVRIYQLSAAPRSELGR